MTKKRFKFADGYSLRYNCIIDNLKGEDKDIHNVLKTDEVLNMLNKLHEENEWLKQSIDIIGGRLQGLWANYNANRWGIWAKAVEDIANELGFKIHHAYDDPISNSESKKERVKGVKKITEILGENELIKQENKELKVTIGEMEDYLARMEEENKELKQHIKELEKELHLAHMRTMFSTVKSFKGDVSRRYYYSEETDTIYDTANNYGQYDKILDKKEVTMLLNEYETLLNERDLND